MKYKTFSNSKFLVSENIPPPISSLQVESSQLSGWDDWSEPDQDEPSDDNESVEEDPYAPVVEPRRQSKQKSVEECIQLLIDNRQKLAQKLEDHQRSRMEEGTNETLDRVQDSLDEGSRQANELESLQRANLVVDVEQEDIVEPTIQMELSPQLQSTINFNWDAEVEEITAEPQNLLHFDENIKMIPVDSETLDRNSSGSTVPEEVKSVAPPLDNLVPTSSLEKPLNEAQAFALSGAVNETAPIFELPQESDVDVPNITKITWNYVEGEPPLVIEGDESDVVLTETEKKLQDFFFQQHGTNFADWIQGKSVSEPNVASQEKPVAFEVQSVQPVQSSGADTSDWQSWEDEEEELNLVVHTVANQIEIPLPLLETTKENPEIPTTRSGEPEGVEELIETKQQISQNELSREKRHFRNPEQGEMFVENPVEIGQIRSAQAYPSRDEAEILFDIENQIDSVPPPFKPVKPVEIVGQERDSEPETLKKFAYQCGDDEKIEFPHLEPTIEQVGWNINLDTKDGKFLNH